MWLCRFLFVALGEVVLEGLFHLLRCQFVENAHAAVIDVQKLYSLAVKVSGRIHHDFVHELVDQLRCQGFQLRDLLDLLNESLQALGFIRFGSRVDVYVPLNSEVLVFVGQKVRAADTVNALLNPQEEEKPETPVEAPAVEAVEVTEVAATADAALAAETKTTEEKTQQQA